MSLTATACRVHTVNKLKGCDKNVPPMTAGNAKLHNHNSNRKKLTWKLFTWRPIIVIL
jgi:hypothetical protein